MVKYKGLWVVVLMLTAFWGSTTLVYGNMMPWGISDEPTTLDLATVIATMLLALIVRSGLANAWVEGGVARFFFKSFSNRRKIYRTIFWVNILTMVLVVWSASRVSHWLYQMGVNVSELGKFLGYRMDVLLVEVIPFVGEPLFYGTIFKRHLKNEQIPAKLILSFSLVANLVTFVLGALIYFLVSARN